MCYTQDINATIVPLGISCFACHCCGLEALQLGRTFNSFPPLAASITLSNSKRDRPEGRRFHVSSSPIPSSPVSKVCSVSNLWEAIKENSSNLCCFGSLLDSSDQQLEGRFSMPHTGTFVNLFCSWEV